MATVWPVSSRWLEVEHEEHRPGETQTDCVILGQLLAHVKHGEGNEHTERDHLLEDLELRQRKHRGPDPVGGYLQQILEQRDSP